MDFKAVISSKCYVNSYFLQILLLYYTFYFIKFTSEQKLGGQSSSLQRVAHLNEISGAASGKT